MLLQIQKLTFLKSPIITIRFIDPSEMQRAPERFDFQRKLLYISASLYMSNFK